MLLVFLVVCVHPAWCYIDPGTGSMLFSALSGTVVAVYFFFKSLWLKVKSLPHLLTGRKERMAMAVG